MEGKVGSGSTSGKSSRLWVEKRHGADMTGEAPPSKMRFRRKLSRWWYFSAKTRGCRGRNGDASCEWVISESHPFQSVEFLTHPSNAASSRQSAGEGCHHITRQSPRALPRFWPNLDHQRTQCTCPHLSGRRQPSSCPHSTPGKISRWIQTCCHASLVSTFLIKVYLLVGFQPAPRKTFRFSWLKFSLLNIWY
jgi:hypothetical protein